MTETIGETLYKTIFSDRQESWLIMNDTSKEEWEGIAQSFLSQCQQTLYTDKFKFVAGLTEVAVTSPGYFTCVIDGKEVTDATKCTVIAEIGCYPRIQLDLIAKLTPPKV